MQKLKLQRNIDALDGEEQFDSEPGRFQGIMVVCEGTNATGVTATAADIGRFIIERQGTQTHNRRFETFAKIGDIRAGSNLFESTEASTFKASIFIPFFEIGFPNGLDIKGNSELNIRFQPDSDVGDNFDDLSVKVYTKATDYRESYQYFMLGNDVNYGAAVTKPEPLNRANITSLFIDDVDDVLDRLQFEQSGQVVVSNIDWDALRADTLYNNRLESESTDMSAIQTSTPGVGQSTLNKESQLDITVSGAGNIQITVCSMKWGNSGQGAAQRGR